MNLIELINTTPGTPAARRRFLDRLAFGNLTRDEDPATHLCVFFLPCNPATKQVFITHHRKSGLWLSPGGHVDQGETPAEAVIRELREELGYHVTEVDPPFLLTVTDITISATPVPCKVHYDFWYLIPTDGTGFNIEMTEFHEVRWLDIPAAQSLIIDPTTNEALNALISQH